MSLFGSTTTAKPFGFGSTSTPTGTTNLFGSSTTNAFGATPAAGSTTTPGANPFAPASTTPGAPTTGGFGATPFGAQNTAPGATGTGLFGASGAGTGAQATGTGLFGATNPNPAAAGTGGLGLFGQPAANAATAAPGTPAPASTGLFGQPATATPATGLFGQPATTNAPAAGGLFGQPAQPAGANTAATGLFGQPAASGTITPGGTTTGGLFGATPAAGANAGTTGLGGAGLFGSKPTGGLFGNTRATTTPGTGLFGSTTAKPGGLFGNSMTTGGFGLGTSALNVQQQQQQQQPASLNAHAQALLGLLTKLQQLQQAIQMQMSQGLQISSTPNSGHQESLEFVGKLGSLLYSLTTEKFQHIFYNVVDSAQVSLYTRPVYVSDTLWEKAVKENPDPRRMVPAFAMGMEDLQKRADAQAKAAGAIKLKLDEIRTKLTALSQRHVLSTSLRSQKLSNNHTLLFQRAVRLSQHLHLLIPLVRSSAIRPEEEMLRARLESIEDELRRGNASKGKMNEMWGAVGQLTALKAREGMGVEGEGKEWAVVDEEGLKRLARILSEQQHGLAHLTRILQDALRDLAVILNQV